MRLKISYEPGIKVISPRWASPHSRASSPHMNNHLLVIAFSKNVFLYHLVIHYLGISLLFNLLILKILRELYNSSNQVLQSYVTFEKLQLPKALRYAFKNFNLAKKHLCLKKRCAQFSEGCFFWKDINILITRVGKNSSTEIHKH